MNKLSGDEMLRLLLIRGRVASERSTALEKKQYGDPAKNVRFKGVSPVEGVKAIEAILAHDLENWMRWGRRRDWMPVSFRCPLGFLFKSTDVHDDEKPIRFYSDDIGAADFERMVISLPNRHRQAFVMYQLGRAQVNGRVRIMKGRDQCASLMGISPRHYNRMVHEAHSMVLRKWKSVRNFDVE